MKKPILIFALLMGLGGMPAAQSQGPQNQGQRERVRNHYTETHGQQVSNVAQTIESGSEKGQVVSETARMRREDRRQLREQRRLDARERRQQRKEMGRERREHRQQHDNLHETPGQRPENTARPQGGQRPNPPRHGQNNGGGRPK